VLKICNFAPEFFQNGASSPKLFFEHETIFRHFDNQNLATLFPRHDASGNAIELDLF